MKEIEIYIDGASKGNPGPSGIGLIICQQGRVIKNIATYIGKTTNNIAEYTAFIYALEEALILKAEYLKVNTDSQLLAQQINKVYKVKSPGIINLYNQATHLLSAFKKVNVNYISRENNRGADKLANKAIKEAPGKIAF
ncbi:reverse transcriptase-like protein [bacterium]|nr:MAG: reverse transcriptase-like protein [bacterium]